MNVTCILPCRGRHTETLDLIPRLINTAGVQFDLICVADGDPGLYSKLYHEERTELIASVPYAYQISSERVGYWHSLKAGTEWLNNERAGLRAGLLANLANDLLPGRDWLAHAINAYLNRFGNDNLDGVIGFNDGVHAGNHAAHMLISKRLLYSWYGDDYWPIMYRHMFGDTEIVERAKQEGVFAIAPWAVLYHNHPVTGGLHDSVYAEGDSTWNTDEALFRLRRANNWQGTMEELAYA